jgi:cation transport regulator ChaB
VSSHKNLLGKQKDQYAQIRKAAESDLETFIRLVHPKRVLGAVHQELLSWWTREAGKRHQLTLLPRDHQKSAMIAYRVAWEITRNPSIRILYISSTQNLAIRQVGFIKGILTSDAYRFYWPEMVEPDEGKRERWTQTEFNVDHPKRKEDMVRDPTVFSAGLTSTIVGMHCDIAVLDDVVVMDNAYTDEGRERVKLQYSLLSSIEGADSKEWVVGTRYHPKDLYNDLLEMAVELYDDEGEIVGYDPLYEVFERQVEDRGDGTGQFLWPRERQSDGSLFGFDKDVLARKRAQYLDPIQFRAQYYNNPNDYETARIKRDLFQYYDPKYLSRLDGRWFFKHAKLNVFAAVDFAFSLSKRADYTAIVVVGVDADRNFYVLDIDRFKSDKIPDYFAHILALHQKWDFRKIRCEVSVAQKVIVTALKNDYIKPHGLALSVDEYNPSRVLGSKEERVDAILHPKYSNHQIWHYRGGNCSVLEEELILAKPAHDDVKDCLASVIDVCVAPTGGAHSAPAFNTMYTTHSRFGGVC